MRSVTTGVISTQWYSSSDPPHADIASGDVGRYCFCPRGEEVWIDWSHVSPANVVATKLELSCLVAGAPTVLWTKRFQWKPGACPAAAKTKFNGDLVLLDKDEDTANNPGLADVVIVPGSTMTALFPNGCLTAEHAPYLLRVSVEGIYTAVVAPLATWLYFDVIVHAIELGWGLPAMIPLERPDLSKPTDRTRVLREERVILNALSTGTLSLVDDGTNAGSLLNVELNFSKFAEGFNHDTTYWGKGPYLPLRAKAPLRTSKKTEALDAPAALGGVRFLWEWQDNPGETRDTWLDRWLGVKTAAANPVSAITRHVFEGLVDAHMSPTYPHHAFNCAVPCGGKRGAASPAGVPVFPDQDGTGAFPYKVGNTCTNRTWAALSEVNATADPAWVTGALFQPSPTAGDRYQVHCILAWEKAGPTYAADVALSSGSYFDLPADAVAKHVPAAKTRYFEVFHKLNVTWYHGPAFAGTEAGVVADVKTQMKRELGYIIDASVEPFPNLRPQLDAAVRRVVSARSFGESKSLLLRCLFPDPPPAPDLDFILDVLAPAPALARLESMFQTGALTLLEAGGNLDGLEIVGATSGACGVSLPLPPANQLGAGKFLVLSVNGTAFQGGELLQGQAAVPINGGPVVHADPVPSCWGLTVNAVHSAEGSKREVTVSAPAVGGIVLTYDQGRVNPTAQLDPTRTAKLDNFIDTVTRSHAPATPLVITVVGRNTKSHDRERIQHVVDRLTARIVDRRACYETFATAVFTDTTKPRHDQLAAATKSDLDSVVTEGFEHHVATLPAIATYREQGRLFFYHMRGRTSWNTFATGAFETGRSTAELGYCFAVEPVAAAFKRPLKPSTPVMAHELGHALFLPHAAPRHFDTKAAGGDFTIHMPHDNCIENYDFDSTSFCAACMLQKRGWVWRGVVPNLGVTTLAYSAVGYGGEPWDVTCENLLRNDYARYGNANGARVRLANFLHFVRKNFGEARTLMDALATALGGLPLGERVWALRNLVVYHNKIDGGNNTSVTAQGHLTTLLTLTTDPVDIDDISASGRLKVSSSLYRWTNTN